MKPRISDRVRMKRNGRRGATVVEFALTVPILFTLVWGSIEFSRANMLVHTVSIAATEGARQAIVPGANVADVKSAVTRELGMVGISDAAIEVLPNVIDDDTNQVTVNLVVPVNLKNGYIIPRAFMGKEIFKSATMQREGKSQSVADESTSRDGVRTTPAR